jgi:hypothetical protein
MDTLQKLFDSSLKKYIDTKTLLRRVVRKKFEGLGVDLNEEQISGIVNNIENVESGDFNIDLDERQLHGSNVALEDYLKDNVQVEFNDADFNEAISEFSVSLKEEIPKIVAEISDVLLTQLRRNARAEVKASRKDRKRFESRLQKQWKKPFELLELFVLIALEAGADFNEQYHPVAAKEDDLVFEVLIRLHARACRITSEVIALMKAGFADGAHARWRTLHEVAVVAMFIAEHGNEVAEKYLLHEIVESYKAAIQHQQYCKAIGAEPLTDQELEEIKTAYQDVLNRFGSNFSGSYGWAAAALGKNKPTFSDIEQGINLEKMRPYYKMASHSVHANPKGIAFTLGLLPEERSIILAGASDTGFADPANGTVVSLLQITTTLLTTKPNIDALTLCSVLMKLENEVGKEFLETQKMYEQQYGEQQSHAVGQA